MMVIGEGMRVWPIRRHLGNDAGEKMAGHARPTRDEELAAHGRPTGD